VQHYRVYVIGQDGRFIKSIDLSCEDDDAAIEATKPLIDGHDLELWQWIVGSRGSIASQSNALG
jgi:hypothetical protein